MRWFYVLVLCVGWFCTLMLMPQRLLRVLTSVPQSGEVLGAQLGLSRSSVHALAQQLLKLGVPLITSREGYALQAGTPAPELVPIQGKWGQELRYYAEVSSTQDVLRAWTMSDNPPQQGAVVVAERQTAGRGRRGRSWQTMQGNLSFSVLLQRSLPLAALPTLPFMAGVAVQRAVGGGLLKWPNDLLDERGRKLAGLLLEADLRGEEARCVVLGIGINVAQAPEGAAYACQYRPEITRAQLLADVLAQLEDVLEWPVPEVLKAWRAHNATLGRRVRLNTEGASMIEGVAQDITQEGSLIIRLDSGILREIHAGEVELIGSWSP